MRWLFDTNVVLDVLLARQPFAADAASLFAAVERAEIDGLLGATTVTTIHYLCEKALGARAAHDHIRCLLDLFGVAPVTEPVLASALDVGFADYEDAVLHEAARAAGTSGIVTRNVKDFKRASLPVYTPEQALAFLSAR